MSVNVNITQMHITVIQQTSFENNPPTADNPRSTSGFTCFTWLERSVRINDQCGCRSWRYEIWRISQHVMKWPFHWLRLIRSDENKKYWYHFYTWINWRTIKYTNHFLKTCTFPQSLAMNFVNLPCKRAGIGVKTFTLVCDQTLDLHGGKVTLIPSDNSIKVKENSRNAKNYNLNTTYNRLLLNTGK